MISSLRTFTGLRKSATKANAVGSDDGFMMPKELASLETAYSTSKQRPKTIEAPLITMQSRPLAPIESRHKIISPPVSASGCVGGCAGSFVLIGPS